MKSPSKVIVPISTIGFNTIAILASSSRLLHFKPGIGMIVRVFDWHIWPYLKKFRSNVLKSKRGFTQTRGQLPCTRGTPSKHFPWSSSITFDLLSHDFQDGAFRVLFETVCQRYRTINPASDRGFKLFFLLWCPLRRGKKEEPMVLEKN